MEGGNGWVKPPVTAMSWRNSQPVMTPQPANYWRLAQLPPNSPRCSPPTEDRNSGMDSASWQQRNGRRSPKMVAPAEVAAASLHARVEVAEMDVRSHFEKHIVKSLQSELTYAISLAEHYRSAKESAQVGLMEGLDCLDSLRVLHKKELDSERAALLEQVHAESEQHHLIAQLLKEELQQQRESFKERQQQLVAETEAARKELGLMRADAEKQREELESYEERCKQLEGDKESIRRELLLVKADSERQQQLEADREAIAKELEVVKVDVRQRQKEMESYEERLQQLAAEKEAVLEELASVKAAAEKQQQEYKRRQQLLVADKEVAQEELLLLKAIDENRRAELAEYKERCKDGAQEESVKPQQRLGYRWRLIYENDKLQKELASLKAGIEESEVVRQKESECRESEGKELARAMEILAADNRVLQKGMADILATLAEKHGKEEAWGFVNAVFGVEEMSEANPRCLQMCVAAIERAVVEERQLDNEGIQEDSGSKVEQQQGVEFF